MAEGRRIDQWLWFARIVKSRSLAARLVTEGQIRINRVKIGKPGKDVSPGDVITAAVHGQIRVLRVLAIGARRGPALEAQGLYEEIAGEA